MRNNADYSALNQPASRRGVILARLVASTRLCQQLLAQPSRRQEIRLAALQRVHTCS